MSRILIVASFFLLTLSAVFGVLNNGKVRTLRADMQNATAARVRAENARAAQGKEVQGRETGSVTAQGASSKSETRIANLESDLLKSQAEKHALQSKLHEKENEISELKTPGGQVSPDSVPGSGPSAADLQTQLDETRKQLERTEKEKELLVDQVRAAKDQPQGTEQRKERSPLTNRPGLRGNVLAVNQAYNFVVLNLGERQGVEVNSEMLVVRRGTLIGKIRVTSVEPATAIGDIISSTLPRGVQVQRGDNVIYAGTN